jgi:ATP-dependent Lhr-like helicase
MAHGRKAVMALVGRGIGPDTAGRILARYHLEEYEFLKDILEAEVSYARTKRFWD